MKTLNDLKLVITNFNVFSKFIKENKPIISKGKLSEYYCSLLFDIKLNEKTNELYDGVDKKNRKVEIKQRIQVSRVPSGMKIDLTIIDYVLYVYLDEDLLPNEIIKIDKCNITQLPKNRVSFKNAKNNKKFEIIYKR